MRLFPGALLVLAFAFVSGIVTAGPLEDAALAYSRKDYATALRIWRPLADLGNPAAQFNVGLMYDNGQGVAQDYAMAMKWYRLAAEQGDAQAQYNLGYLFDNGQGAARDYVEAAKWYRMAAAQGDPRAQDSLGQMYANGQGVPKDFVRAHMWFSVAAMSGQSWSAAKNRDVISKQLTPRQAVEAQELAGQCRARLYKGCDTLSLRGK